jgi:hypothetical protein
MLTPLPLAAERLRFHTRCEGAGAGEMRAKADPGVVADEVESATS